MKQKRYFISLIILLTFLLQNCKKNCSEIVTNETSTSILGNWELRQEQTKTIPQFTYQAGNGNIIKFTSSNYSTFANGNVIKNGQYKLNSDPTAALNVCLVLPENEFKNRIIFDSVYNSPKTFIEISKDSLKFISGCFAGQWILLFIHSTIKL